MNKFNLTFSGEILTGHDPEEVKRGFGEMFSIDDPERLERFFTGETIILRRNLERKEAAQYFHELHLLGAVAALVKITEDATGAGSSPAPGKQGSSKKTGTTSKVVKKKKKARKAPRRDAAAQVWAVSSRVAKEKPHDPDSADDSRQGKLDISARIKARKEESQQQAKEQARDAAAAKAREEEEKQAQAKAEAAQREAEREEKKRLETEATAQRNAKKEKEKAERARKKAEKAEKEAKRKAKQEEKKRQEAEKAARRKAELEEKKRRETEEATRKAELEEQERQEAEAAALRKAELEQKNRQEAEEAAQRKAELEEKKRREAEEAARRKVELEEKKRREAEEAAQRKAELEEKLRQEAEEAARKAALEEKKRQKAEKAARRKAEREEKQRLEAEEAGRRKAELEEKQRREAEEAARRKAELEEKQRREAEEAARRKAELEEKQRREAQEAARRKAEQEERKRLENEEVDRLAKEIAEIQRQENAEIEQVRAESQQRRLAAERYSQERIQAIRQKRPLEALAEIPRTVEKTSRRSNVTNLRTSRSGPRARKRQPGEPNFYKLRPFRNSKDIRARSARAHGLKRRAYILGVIALAFTLVATERFVSLSPEPTNNRVSAIAQDARSGVVLLVGDTLLLHDRAGVGSATLPLKTLGLDSLAAPLAFDEDGTLLALGKLSTESGTSSEKQQLLRCNLEARTCQSLSTASSEFAISTFAINPIDSSVIAAGDGQLLKFTSQGELAAQAEITLPPRPVLRLHTGLLFVNSAQGPGISVYRYEDDSFGKQLDEILLLPPEATAAEQSSTGNFTWSGDAWWATLYNAETGSTGLYRFDAEWNPLGAIPVKANGGELQLASWGEKTLANNFSGASIQRFNAAGEAESPFLSAQLEELITDRQHRANLTGIAWRTALVIALLTAVLGLGTGVLQGLRELVYKPHRERGAEPIDDYADDIRWIEPLASRQGMLRSRLLSYGVLAFALLMLAMSQDVSVSQLAALMLLLSGPAIALLLMSRSPMGHIGLLKERLLLVDHNAMYHLAGGSGVQYRGPFLLIDDVVVFCGTALLPAFPSKELKLHVTPVASGGIKIDRKTVLVKLLQCRHPLAIGGCVILACSAAALVVLGLQGIIPV